MSYIILIFYNIIFAFFIFCISEKAPKNPITCIICTDLIELVDEQLTANGTIDQVIHFLFAILSLLY